MTILGIDTSLRSSGYGVLVTEVVLVLFQFDLVAWLGGGQNGVLARIIYIVVGLAAIWCVSLLFRDSDVLEDHSIGNHA